MSGPLTFYGFPASLQLKSLLFFFGVGFLAGVVYDLLRLLRLALPAYRWIQYVFDGAFVLIFAGMAFCTSLAVCMGELHFFMLLAAAFGFVVYYVTLDGFVRRATDGAVRAIRRGYAVLFRIFSVPVRVFLRAAVGTGKILAFPVKKITFFLKKLLQKTKRILYNKKRLYPIKEKVSAFQKSTRTETPPDDKKQRKT